MASIVLLAVGPATAQAQPFDTDTGGTSVVKLGAGTALFGVAPAPGGGSVAAGQSNGHVLVERFDSAGNPSGQPYVGPAGYARAVAIQSDGKVVFAGASGGAMLVGRLTSALAPDPTFNGGGAATAFAGQGGSANAVAIGPGGTIVAAGSVFGGDTRVGLAEFTSNGSPDLSLNASGSEVPGYDHYSVAQGVAVQPDGKIVLVGHQAPDLVTDALVARLNPNGSPDSGFVNPNGTGVFTYHYTASGGGYTALNAVTLQNDGKIVAAGVDAGGPNALFLRLNPGGSFDASFGSGGVTALPSSQNLTTNSSSLGAYGVGIAGGGRIVAAGNFTNAGSLDAAAWAVTASGAPEAAFGAGGTELAPTNGYEACGLTVLADGTVITVGDGASFPDRAPCTGGTGGFVARYPNGFGAPPPPPAGAAAPTLSTGAATAITAVSATVSGQVNPHGSPTSYHFDYGPTAAYGSSTGSSAAGSGTQSTPVSSTLHGLRPSTTYHYRLVAGNAGGVVGGSDAQFRTAAARPPSAGTRGTTALGEIAAKLTGQINAQGLPTSYHFDYGRSAGYGSSTRGGSLAAGSSPVGVSSRVTGLHPSTTYHYRLVAHNAGGTSYGADRKFKTLPLLKASLHKLAASFTTTGVGQDGLALTVDCNQGCSVKGTLLISRTLAKNLGLIARQFAIGSGSASIRRAGTVHVRLHLTAAARAKLAGQRRLNVTLRIVVGPAGGGRSSLAGRSLVFTS